jgi:predicted PurR-regulated permease PerM
MATRPGSWTVERVRLTAVSAILVVGALALTGVARAVVVEARQPLGWALASAIVAVLLTPIARWLDRHLPRGLAIALTMIGLVTLVVGLVVGVAAELRTELDRLEVSLVDAAEELEQDESLGEFARDLRVRERVEEFVADLDERYSEGTTLEGAVGTVPSYFVNAILVVFFLVWGPKIYAAFIRQFAVDEQRERLEHVLTRGTHLARRYLLVVIAQALAIGALTAGVLWLADIPTPALVGLVVGAMSLVPHAGIVFASLLPLLLAAALQPGWVTASLALFFIGLQIASSAVVQRRLHESTLRVGPAVIVICALLGYAVYDLGGAFYAVVLGVFAVAVLDVARAPAESSATLTEA